MTPLVLEPELRFFEPHRFEFLERAAGKYALIKGEQLAGTFDSEEEAVRAGYRMFGGR